MTGVSKMDYSFIIPTYNSEKVLERCVLSIEQDIKLSGFSCEIIIIENGSTDNTISCIEKLSEQYRQTVKVTDWVEEQHDSAVHFIHVTNYADEDLKKIIMNYYYKEDIEYINIYEYSSRTMKTFLRNISQSLNYGWQSDGNYKYYLDKPCILFKKYV